MRRLKLVLSLMAALLLMIGSGIVTKAASYKYLVTIDPGLHGIYSGTAEMEIPYGATWNPADYEGNVTVTDDRYYFKGFHISGVEGIVGTTTITEDTVFVASYGMKGQTVAYTVNYVDAKGETLHKSATYYGNVGDKPVVAFRYVDGYLPQAYNLTQTLDADASKNVFTFTYNKVQPKVVGTSGSGGVKYVVEDGGVVYIQLPAQNTARKGYAASASNANANAAAASSNTSSEQSNQEVKSSDEEKETPETIIDLDQTDDKESENTSSESSDGTNGNSTASETPKKGLSTGAKVGIGAAGVGLLALLIAFLRAH